MYGLLSGMRVIECGSFIAAPLCGLHLQQMGAEVIRLDMIGGGPDFNRWPRAPKNGASLYWEGLNKGKKSVAIDLSSPEGRELAVRIAGAPGRNAGLLVTNYPVNSFLSHERVAAGRPDLITVRIMGWGDGTSAVDYTVNAAVGVPLMTGPAELGDEPVNHVLPSWDITAGTYAAFVLLAAERERASSGRGGEARVALGDVAMATLGNLGQVAEVALSGQDRPRYGNDLYGAFGRDFECADGRVMIAAITSRQWTALLKALSIADDVSALEAELGVDFSTDEGVRFAHRERLNPLVAKAIRGRHMSELRDLFDATAVCWAPYRQMSEALGDQDVFSYEHPLFSQIEHGCGYTYPTPGPAAALDRIDRAVPSRAPALGEHTEDVLADLLGLGGTEIARLHDRGLVASAAPAR